MKRCQFFILSICILLSFSALSWSQSGRKAAAAQNVDKAVTLKGEITNLLMPLATFKTEDREFTVHLGPFWYWKQENLKLEKGKVEIIGEQEEVDGRWHLYPNKIIQGETTILLVSDDGVPKWANQTPRKGQRRVGFRGCRHHGHGCCR
jgi:hypothetical protein